MEQKPKSIIDSKCEFDKEEWVISVLNTGSKLQGHSIIVVEGMREDGTLFGKPFINQYDIQATAYAMQESSIETKGFVSEIRIFKDTTRDYSQCTSTSYCASSLSVKKMIKSIKENKVKVDQLREMIQNGTVAVNNIDSVYIKNNGFFEYGFIRDNCAHWCIDKVAIAGIHINAFGKPEKVAGGCALF